MYIRWPWSFISCFLPSASRTRGRNSFCSPMYCDGLYKPCGKVWVDIFMIRVLRPEYCGPFENSYKVMIHKTLDLNITFTYFNLVRHEDSLSIYGRSHKYGPYSRERRPPETVIIDSNVARIDFVIGEQYLRDGRDKFLFEFIYQPSRKNEILTYPSLRYATLIEHQATWFASKLLSVKKRFRIRLHLFDMQCHFIT